MAGPRVYLLHAAAALLIGSRFLTATAQDASLFTGHAIGALFFVVLAGKIVQSTFDDLKNCPGTLFWRDLRIPVAGRRVGSYICDDPCGEPRIVSTWQRNPAANGTGDSSRNIFMYYSFVTLTTVGYGDVTPASIPARTLSWVEAVTGQLYLAVLIAGLISAMVARNAAPNRRS